MEYRIRRADANKDAGEINLIRLQPEVMKTIASLPSEEVGAIRRMLDDEHDIFFVAETVEEPIGVVGFLSLWLSGEPRYSHSGQLGIMIHRDYHRAGIGRALMSAAIDRADSVLGLKRLELTVDVSNVGAIRLYESLGFRKEGLLKKTTITCGSYIDDFLMGRLAPGQESEGCGEDLRFSNAARTGSEGIGAGSDGLDADGSDPVAYYVRPVDIKDAPGICRLFNEAAIPKNQEETQKDLANISEETHRLVAVEAGKETIRGFATLTIPRRPRLRNNGSVFILAAGENKQKVIEALLTSVIDLADNWICLVRMETVVTTDDAETVSAYKKAGFEIEARKQKSVFYHGRYFDEYVLGRLGSFH